MNSKPLTYNCLESVIKHTDLNKRLQLKARCSSVKPLERNVPLEIDTLDFSGKHLVVNDVEYRIGIIQKCCPIKIKTLIVAHESVIRAPIGLKLKIEELKIVGQIDLDRFEDIFNQLKPILDESSFPLRSLDFPSKTAEDFQHEIVRTAGKLIVKWTRIPRDLFHIYTILPNRRVITEVCYSLREYYIEFIRRWKVAGRIIGTHYSFIVCKDLPAIVLKLLQQDAISKGKHWVVIPFNDVSNLKVSRTAPDELSFEVIELFPE